MQRWGPQALADLCHRLATSLHAGLDDARIWQGVAADANAAERIVLTRIRDKITAGRSWGEALQVAKATFPPLFLELVEVGERTGRLAEVLTRLADHYRQRSAVRREFIAAIISPMLQLAAALGVVGLLILIRGSLGESPSSGLQGTSGLLIYLLVLVGVGIAGWLYWREPVRQHQLQHWVDRFGVVRRCREAVALAEITWILQLCTESAMDLRHSVRLALSSSGAGPFAKRSDHVAAVVADGQPLHVALDESGGFPRALIQMLEVGDASGTLAETLGRLAEDYRIEAQERCKKLARWGAATIWCLVSLVLIVLIFRFALQYVDLLQSV